MIERVGMGEVGALGGFVVSRRGTENKLSMMSCSHLVGAVHGGTDQITHGGRFVNEFVDEERLFRQASNSIDAGIAILADMDDVASPQPSGIEIDPERTPVPG